MKFTFVFIQQPSKQHHHGAFSFPKKIDLKYFYFFVETTLLLMKNPSCSGTSKRSRS